MSSTFAMICYVASEPSIPSYLPCVNNYLIVPFVCTIVDFSVLKLVRGIVNRRTHTGLELEGVMLATLRCNIPQMLYYEHTRCIGGINGMFCSCSCCHELVEFEHHYSQDWRLFESLEAVFSKNQGHNHKNLSSHWYFLHFFRFP